MKHPHLMHANGSYLFLCSFYEAKAGMRVHHFLQCAPHNGSPLFAFKGVRTFFQHPRLAFSWCSCCQQLGSCLCGGPLASLMSFMEGPQRIACITRCGSNSGSNPHHVSGIAQGIWSILIHKARKIQKSSTKSEASSSFMLSNLYSKIIRKHAK